MTYNQTLNWLFKKLPMYQREGQVAYKSNLDNTQKLDLYLNCPHKTFKSVHIPGTNGKGSTAHMLASILQEAGYKTGLYTSPHLKDFRERIKINGHKIPKGYIQDFIKEHKKWFEKENLSFFEMTVGLCFDYFSKKKVDIAIIEVGLGGRLDSTNILKPILSVITNVGKDHTQFLGETLQEIASEKAGIIKERTPVIIGEKQPSIQDVFLEKAKTMSTTLSFARPKKYKSGLLGDYQTKNINTAAATVKELQKLSFKITEKHITLGLKKVIQNTGLQGRWEVLSINPRIICDTAHNPEAIQEVLNQVEKESKAEKHFIIGFVLDKNLEEILSLFPKKAFYYFVKPEVPRGMSAKELQTKAREFQLEGSVFKNTNKALESAKIRAKKDDTIFVGGSTFVVSEIV